ncbi:MAG: redoxin domain-containing protein [Bacteroidota bacterium]
MIKLIPGFLLPCFLLICHYHSFGQSSTQSGFFTVTRDNNKIIFTSSGPGDTMKGRVCFKQMNKALLDAKTLRFNCYQVQESNMDGKNWKHEINYAVWLKKGNRARVEIRDVIFPDDGSDIIYDGKSLWAYYVGTNSTVALDENTILGKVKNRYLTKDISQGSSLSHDMMNYGSSVSMPVLYLSKFFGYQSALEDKDMTVSYIGEDTVSGVMTHHIKVQMLGGQRIADYWISLTDNFPRKMEEVLVMNASANSKRTERWSNVSFNVDMPDSLFCWKPPDNWIEYSHPTQKALEDSQNDKKKNLNGTFVNLDLIGGGKFNLRDYSGKIVLLVFWRLGCPPCRSEMPWLQKIYEKYKEKGFTVVGFNHVDNKALVKEYLDKKGISYPNILDSSARAKKIYTDFKTNTVPLSCLIDRKGNLIALWYGFDADEDAFGKKLDPLL